MNELALFAGAGGGILAGQLLGWRCIGACEIEKYPRKVLLARQRDGILPKFPIWDDVRTFDGRPWRGLVDVVSGGFPCQDISSAGKGAGLDGKRSGLWSEMLRVVCEVRPQYVFVENSPLLTRRGLGRVLGGLAAAGYDAAWICLSAADCGAPHERKRLWLLGVLTREEKGLADAAQLVADTNAARLPQGAPERPVRAGGRCELAASCDEVPDTASSGQAIRLQTDAGEHSAKGETPPIESCPRCTAPSHPDMPGREKQRQPEPAGKEQQAFERGGWWSVEPRLGRVADGVANRVDRLKALGNGQVPIVAATAFRILYRQLTNIEYQP